VLITALSAPVLGTGCYVVTGRAGRCIVVDPGIGVLAPLREVLAAEVLTVEAVVLTHGHVDHTWSAAAVAADAGAPVLVHADDAHRLGERGDDVGPGLMAALQQQMAAAGLDPTWRPPGEVHEVRHGEVLDLAGLAVRITHAPGHTEGSVLLALDGVPEHAEGLDVASTVLTGDVLFAGSIGRTDLPGGDHPTMLATLRTHVLALPDTALLLPGHGPATTMAAERASNPFLTGLVAAG